MKMRAQGRAWFIGGAYDAMEAGRAVKMRAQGEHGLLEALIMLMEAKAEMKTRV